jgi:uncharacterized protein
MTLLRVALFWAGYLAVLWLAAFPKQMVPDAWGPLVWGVVSLLIIAAATRWMERREGRAGAERTVAFDRGSVTRFALGLLVGVAAYVLVTLGISLLVTPIHFHRSVGPTVGVLALTVTTILALATMEELGFRGYSLRALHAALGAWPAQCLVAIAFGLCHVLFGWPWLTVLMGVVPSALLFGAAAQRSGGIAMAIGVHAALNLAQTMVGEKSVPGYWSINFDPNATESLARWAPPLGAVTTLLCAAVVWWWPRRSPKGGAPA